MSELNVLNPTAGSLFNPDYAYTEAIQETRSVFQAASGRIYTRRQAGLGRTFDLTWVRRDDATSIALRQWERQYENDFFTLVDWIRGRYFSGRFEGPLTFTPEANAAWTIKGKFVELPTVNLNTYPSNWTSDAIFLEERDGFGNDLVKLTGTWTYSASAHAHGGNEYQNGNNNTTDMAEWIYFGYGCQIWARKDSNLGKFTATVTRVRDGNVMVTGTVDQYNATAQDSAALFTQTNNPLDFYRVGVKATDTKNSSSSALVICADALQVMQ